jgi:cytochrome bd-type quinol oxidase subunit 1
MLGIVAWRLLRKDRDTVLPKSFQVAATAAMLGSVM